MRGTRRGAERSDAGEIVVKINIHNTTPTSKTPKYLVYMFVGLFVLMYGLFAMMAFCLVYYGNNILVAIIIALIPFSFLFWILWEQNNLANSYVEIFNDYIIVTEYPWGRKSVRQIQVSDIDHAKLLTPSSMNLRGPRIYYIGIPYIVFYDKKEKQLLKLLAYPKSKEFQQSITNIVNT